MYLLSTLYDTIVISWFANCYRKKNDVCLICINITTYVMSQQHRCSKGIVDVSHNIVTVSACFHGSFILNKIMVRIALISMAAQKIARM